MPLNAVPGLRPSWKTMLTGLAEPMGQVGCSLFASTTADAKEVIVDIKVAK
jgi:hypothetical protein